MLLNSVVDDRHRETDATRGVFGITKRALEVAACQPDKNSRLSDIGTLSLDRGKYAVNVQAAIILFAFMFDMLDRLYVYHNTIIP